MTEAKMKVPQTLFLLAADRDFRLLRGTAGSLDELEHRTADDFEDVYDRGTGSPGRNRAATVTFGTTELDDREERRRFARHAVAALEAHWSAGKAQRIALVAGPKMLGELRGALPKALAAHVSAELGKDLVKVAVHDLPSHFADVPGV
jgi:protein required for attachment to host cells